MIKYLIKTVATHGVNFVPATHSRAWWCGEEYFCCRSFGCGPLHVCDPSDHSKRLLSERTRDFIGSYILFLLFDTQQMHSFQQPLTFEHWNLSRYFCCLSASSLLVTTFSYFLLSFEVVVLHAVAITFTRCFAPSRTESAPRSALQNLDSTPLNR